MRQALPLELALDLVGVDEAVLVRQVREVLLIALPNNFKNLNELIVLANFRRSVSILEVQTRRDWVAARTLEQHPLLRIPSISIHLIREVHALAQDAADAPNVRLLIVVTLC